MALTLPKNPLNVVQHERMIQSQESPDFFDPTHEWRRLFAEMPERLLPRGRLTSKRQQIPAHENY